VSESSRKTSVKSWVCRRNTHTHRYTHSFTELRFTHLNSTSFGVLSIILTPVLPCARGLVMTSQDIIDDRSLIQYLAKAQFKGSFCHLQSGRWMGGKVPKRCCGEADSTVEEHHRFLSTEVVTSSAEREATSQQGEDGSVDNGMHPRSAWHWKTYSLKVTSDCLYIHTIQYNTFIKAVFINTNHSIVET